MHEYSIACEIFEQVIATAKTHGASEVRAVTLEIGRLAHANPEQLKFCFEILAEGSIAEGAEFIVEMLSPAVECECGYSGKVEPPEHPAGRPGEEGGENAGENEEESELHRSELLEYVAALNCPACGKAARITGGQELIIKTIDIETDAEAKEETEEKNRT